MQTENVQVPGQDAPAVDELGDLFGTPSLDLPPAHSRPAATAPGTAPALDFAPRWKTDPAFRAEAARRFGIVDAPPSRRAKKRGRKAEPVAPPSDAPSNPSTPTALSPETESHPPAISTLPVEASRTTNSPTHADRGENEPETGAEPAKISVPSRRRKRSATRFVQRQTCSKSFRTLLLDRHPALAGRPDYARLFAALLSPRRASTDKTGGGVVVLKGSTLAGCMAATVPDAERLYRDAKLIGESNTGAFHAAFNADVFGGRLEVRERYSPAKRARTVRVDDVRALIHPDVWEAWERERTAPVHTLAGRVYLDDGSAFNKDSPTAERKRIERTMRGYEREAHCELAARVARYMNGRDTLPARSFDGLDFAAARRVAECLTNPTARTNQLDLLPRIEEQPVPYYGFSPHSPRIWGVGDALTGLKSSVRRALMPFAVEYDWSSVHFAISAQDWRLPDLHAFLLSGAPLWYHLLSAMGLPQTEEYKRVVKEPGYGLNYGAGERRIKADAQAAYEALTGSEMHADALDALLGHPLMREALAGRKRELQRIREETNRQGYVLDCFGMPVFGGAKGYGAPGKEDYSRSVLSRLNQARELSLMEPLLDLAEREAAKRRPAWRIVLWQHDGVSVRYYRDRERNERRIMEAMDAHAARHGYPTRFERKHG